MAKTNPKTIDELKQRMLDGERFMHEDSRELFYEDKKEFLLAGESPFRIGKHPISKTWGCLDLIIHTPSWEDDVSESNPVLCWVVNNPDNIGRKRNARLISDTPPEDEKPKGFYTDMEGVSWCYAWPVCPNDCWSKKDG